MKSVPLLGSRNIAKEAGRWLAPTLRWNDGDGYAGVAYALSPRGMAGLAFPIGTN